MLKNLEATLTRSGSPPAISGTTADRCRRRWCPSRERLRSSSRAASLTGNPERAETEARRAAEANLATSGMSCRGGLDITVDTDQFRPGGWVGVTIVCHAAFSDVAMLAVPGERAFTASSVEVIDTCRADNR